MSELTLEALAEWPKIMTVLGSPPNLAMFLWIHWSAAI